MDIKSWVRFLAQDQRFLCNLGTVLILLAAFTFWIGRVDDYSAKRPNVSNELVRSLSLGYWASATAEAHECE